MTVEELVKALMQHDQKKRVVVSDTDGAGREAEDVEFIDQRNDRGENVITIWIHK
jgi:hypothetical protein